MIPTGNILDVPLVLALGLLAAVCSIRQRQQLIWAPSTREDDQEHGLLVNAITEFH